MKSPVTLQGLASNQALRTFALGTVHPHHPACRNFLFLVGHGLSGLDRLVVSSTARQLAPHGYVYVADVQQDCLEDRDDIRYLPLHEDRLPHFGAVSLVAVLRDSGLALRAAQAYPDAKVYVIDHDFCEQATSETTQIKEPAF